MLSSRIIASKCEQYYDKVSHFLFYGLVIIVPLAVYPSALDQVLLVKYFLLIIIAMALLGLFVLKTTFVGTKIMGSGLEGLIFAFMLILSTATALSTHVPTSLEGSYLRYDGLISYFICISLFFLATQHLTTKESLENLIKLAVLSASIVSIYGIAQQFGFDPIPWGFISFDTGRSFSTFGNPILLGGYLSLMLPSSIGLLIGSKTAGEKILYSISTVVIASCLIMAMSRAAWLGIIVGLITMAALAIKRRSVSWRVTIIPVAAVLSATILTLISVGLPVIASRVTSIITLDGSTANRLLMWDSAIKMISSKPLFGFGLDAIGLSFSRYEPVELARVLFQDSHNNVHNAFLQLATGAGIPALLLYIAVLVVLLIKATRHINSSIDTPAVLIGLYGGVVAFIVQSMTGVTGIATSSFFWLFMGSLAASWSQEGITLGPVSSLRKYITATIVIAVMLLGTLISTRVFLSDIYLGKARVAERAGNAVVAESMYKTSIGHNPWDDKARREYGIMLADIGRSIKNRALWLKGIAYLNEAVQLSPDNYKNLTLTGQGYLYGARVFDGKYYKDSERFLKESLKARPFYPESRAMLGVVYLETGYLDEAINHLNKAIEINPGDPQAHYYMGRYYEKLGQKNDAIKEYLTILQADGSNVKARDSYERLIDERK